MSKLHVRRMMGLWDWNRVSKGKSHFDIFVNPHRAVCLIVCYEPPHFAVVIVAKEQIEPVYIDGNFTDVNDLMKKIESYL
jgi:hypothetical protein